MWPSACAKGHEAGMWLAAYDSRSTALQRYVFQIRVV